MAGILMSDERMSHNQATGVWCYEWHDEADTVAYTATLAEMERLIDWAENNVRLLKDRGLPPTA